MEKKLVEKVVYFKLWTGNFPGDHEYYLPPICRYRRTIATQDVESLSEIYVRQSITSSKNRSNKSPPSPIILR